MYWQKYGRYIIGILLIVVLFFVLGFFAEVVSYVLISWVISMVGQPIMSFLLLKLKLMRFDAGKSIAALLTIVILF